MGLSIQYFVVYTVLAMDRTDNQFTSNAHIGVRKILENACNLLTCAAMLNVLLLAASTHAIKITQNKPKKYKMPQLWTQTAMLCCVNAVPAQVISVLVIHTLTHANRDH